MKKFMMHLTMLCVLAGLCATAQTVPSEGFFSARFSCMDTIDTTSVVPEDDAHYASYPSDVYPTWYSSSGLPEYTTAAYVSYMYMEAGTRYYFRGCYDDYVAR